MKKLIVIATLAASLMISAIPALAATSSYPGSSFNAGTTVSQLISQFQYQLPTSGNTTCPKQGNYSTQLNSLLQNLSSYFNR